MTERHWTFEREEPMLPASMQRAGRRWNAPGPRRQGGNPVTQAKRKQHPGVRVRHSRSCRTTQGGSCSCQPTYEAWVFSVRDQRKIRKSFPTLAAAKAWRSDAAKPAREGRLRVTRTTLRDAWEAWFEGATEGTIRNRSGDAYKPSVLRSYEIAMRKRVLPDLGGAKLSDITRHDLQDLADRLLAKGADPSTIRNTFMPLRAIYRRATGRDVAVNPTAGLELPAVRGRRERVASPQEAAALIAAVPERDRAVWAAAFYAGLRRGELQALTDGDVDLAEGVIRVRKSWDKAAGLVDPKSRAGVRKVPVVGVLRSHLAAHRLRRGSIGGFFFGGGRPFSAETLQARADAAWKKAKLERIGLHDARHTYASLSIAAGVNAKALSTYMGHASITITLDRYGHLMPGNESEAAELLDRYLTGAQTGAQATETPS